MRLEATGGRSTGLFRQVIHSRCKHQRHFRLYATDTKLLAREALRARGEANTLPTIPTCPKPTCRCAEMPSDLDIDRKTDLNSTMAPYAEHLVVFSGQADWTSKIEDEKDTAPWGTFVANVKAALSQKGDFHDPYHNVVVSTSSFALPQYDSRDNTTQALLFPSFRLVERIRTPKDAIPDFVKTFLLPERLHQAHGQLSERERAAKTRSPSNLVSDHWMRSVRPISSPTILICSHNTRDSRCGIIGPLLHAEFMQYIDKRHSLRNKPKDLVESAEHTFSSHPVFLPDVVERESLSKQPINVGMISHIGGHKFAGNVIVYIPPDYQCKPIERKENGAKPVDTEESRHENSNGLSEEDITDPYASDVSPLAGKGIWYGRVEPQHVEGIVEQTIGHGTIIKELFRGGVNQDGSPVRLPLY